MLINTNYGMKLGVVLLYFMTNIFSHYAFTLLNRLVLRSYITQIDINIETIKKNVV